jgi:catabolite regulation protein CreA
MSVNDPAVSGPVSCYITETDHTVIKLGTFDLVHGSGSWAAPGPADSHDIAAARLVSSTGKTIATASFG